MLKNKTGLGLLIAGLYGIYLGYLLISTWQVDTVILPPDNCQKAAALPSIHYSDFKFFAVLKQKRKALELGANTLYLPPQIGANGLTEGRQSAIAYRCP